MKPEDAREVQEEAESTSSEWEQFLQRLQRLAGASGIVLPTKPKRKAEMPTIQVTGTPLSQIIIEDRR
jgi:hypothetical protein